MLPDSHASAASAASATSAVSSESVESEVKRVFSAAVNPTTAAPVDIVSQIWSYYIGSMSSFRCGVRGLRFCGSENEDVVVFLQRIAEKARARGEEVRRCRYYEKKTVCAEMRKKKETRDEGRNKEMVRRDEGKR